MEPHEGRGERAPLALVVPLFNEVARFEEFGSRLMDFVAGYPPGSELIFVDDGSSDDTTRLVDDLIAQRQAPFARLLRRAHEGKGAAIAAGLRDSTSAYAGFCDLDLSTPLDEFDKIVEVACQAHVLAIGSRDLMASNIVRRQSRTREALGRTYNRLLQMAVTPGIVDTQCGAKVASRRVWDRVLPFCRQSGFAWDAEVVAVAQALGFGVQEVAIRWQHDDRSSVRVGRDGLAMVAQTPRVWRSARAAARARPPAPRPVPVTSTTGGVFEGKQAEELMDADRTHWWFRGKAAFVATALARTGGSPDGLLVDVGGGSGGVTAMLGLPPDRVVVLDGSGALVRHAHTVVGLHAIHGLADPLPLATSSVDVVCLLDVIEHLDDPSPALLEARRVLADGGRLVITVPAHQWLWSSADVYLGHFRRYNRRLLKRSLAAAGFEPVLLGHVFSWLVPPVWIERRLRHPQKPALGLDRASFLIDRAALVLTAIERLLLGRTSLPVGTSVLCVARAAATEERGS